MPGIVLGLEMERAKTDEIPNELIQSVKTALAGPFAGIGDSLIQGLLIPILLSIAISLSDGGSVIGVLFLIGAYFLICFQQVIWLRRGICSSFKEDNTILEILCGHKNRRPGVPGCGRCEPGENPSGFPTRPPPRTAQAAETSAEF